MKTILAIILFIASIEVFAQQSRILDRSSLNLKSSVDYNKLKKAPDSERLFNFNPILTQENLNDNDGIFKNFVKDESSVLLVFASNEKSEKPLMTLANGKTRIDFSNRKISRGNELPYKNVEAKNGVILSYLFSVNYSKRNNYISLNNYYPSTDTSFTDLLELIYFPETLPEIDRKVIESYLSIKHGISLLGNVDYYNSDTAKVWDSQLNSNYNYRVTGIGRDDNVDLLQKQSKNSFNDGLIIGLNDIKTSNSENISSIKNLNSVMWGDNNKSTKFYESSQNNIAKISRTWAVQTTKNKLDTILNQVMIETSRLFNNDTAETRKLWMVKYSLENDTLNADYIKQESSSGDLAIFNNINFDKTSTGNGYFSFIKAPEFFAITNIDQSSCKCQNSGDIKFKIYGGISPFTLAIKGDKFSNVISEIENGYVLKNIPAGRYNISVSDALGNLYSDVVTIEEEKVFNASIQAKWYLKDDGPVEIKPEIIKNTNSIQYRWLKNEILVSEDSIYHATEQGIYRLIITNMDGCIKTLKFEIEDDNYLSEKVSIFPNPVLVSGKFNIVIDLEEKSDIEIRICEIEGKTIKIINLQNILLYEKEEQILIPGTYVIHVKTNTHTYSKKLIVV